MPFNKYKMDKKRKEIEAEEEIDVKKIYLRNFKQHQPRVGKEYQAVIPECISVPKTKENKIENNPKPVIKEEEKKITNKEIPIKNKQNEEEKYENKNQIIGYKTKEKEEERNDVEDYLPHKKKKII